MGDGFTIGALRGLSPSALLLFGARCALRVQPFASSKVKPVWRAAIIDLCRVAQGGAPLADIRKQTGALFSGDDNGLRDELASQAASALSEIWGATAADTRAARAKAALSAHAHSRSVAALLAHAGRTVKAGTAHTARDVDAAVAVVVAASRADAEIDAARWAALCSSATPRTLLAFAPLWPTPPPPWFAPPAS